MAITMGTNKKGHSQAYLLYEGEEPSQATECCSQCGACHVNTGHGTICDKCDHEFQMECFHDPIF